MNKLLYNNELSFRLLRHLIFFAATVIVFALILFIQDGKSNFSI